MAQKFKLTHLIVLILHYFYIAVKKIKEAKRDTPKIESAKLSKESNLQ